MGHVKYIEISTLIEVRQRKNIRCLVLPGAPPTPPHQWPYSGPMAPTPTLLRLPGQIALPATCASSQEVALTLQFYVPLPPPPPSPTLLRMEMPLAVPRQCM